MYTRRFEKERGKNDNVRKCDQMFQIKAEQIQGGVKVGNLLC